MMVPQLAQADEPSGIGAVVRAYYRWLPDYDIQLVTPGAQFDIQAGHAISPVGAAVYHNHGLHWTNDYEAASWEWRVNERVVDMVRHARIVTVPSEWVAETFRRDMHLNPVVINHGIDLDEWGEPGQPEGYALWNKNRVGDVCDPGPTLHLARHFSKQKFVMTLTADVRVENVKEIGLLPHDQMKQVVKHASVYLSTTKETFGIGTLEALASGVPVLGFAEGGNLETVEHGVTGYLAKPNNMQDLVDGFDYIMANRSTLSDNAIEAAKRWSWPKVVEQVAEVYRRAAEPDPPTVSIVIPTYNYGEKVGRAIESAIKQTYGHVEQIVVVDDGTIDGGLTKKTVEGFTKNDPRIKYVHQANAGVAIARNTGIKTTTSKYITCLDADDALEPDFVKRCVSELERDRSLGIAYTKIKAVKPDGSWGISAWPGEFDYDSQLKRQNQIPTACVFRREMFDRLGGYRQRYAPKGAGAEDGEFWLRAGAMGWGAKLATVKPLFVYSFQSGQVSGDPEYREMDWLQWHPWTKDGLHPFASRATARRKSHAVRQYDQPDISIVIPVGPGHASLLVNALDSLEAQTFRQWEVIVVWDVNEGTTGAEYEQVRRSYPFIRDITLMPGIDGPVGAGLARNRGAEIARGTFLMFLDADDWLYPEALEKCLDAWRFQQGVIYFDYVGKAFVDDPSKLAPDLQERLYRYENGEAITGHKSQDYDPDKAQRQPDGEYPYLWTNVTSLVPKSWHDAIGGFDATLSSWEDVDYHWRLARAGHCYVRIPEELMVYRLSTGGRRQVGLQNHRELIEYLSEKYKEIETVGCNCGGGMKYRSTNGHFGGATAPSRNNLQALGGSGGSMSDKDYVRIRYNSPNRGQHAVVGPQTKTKYGHRAGGDTFLMHKSDVVVNPALYQEIGEGINAPIPAPPTPPATPTPAPTAEVSEAEFNLRRLPGVTSPIAAELEAQGVKNADDLLNMGVDGLVQVKGIGPAKAEAIYGAVQQLAALASTA